MNKLPLTANSLQATAKPAPAAQASKSMPATNMSADSKSPTKSFGDVLARHVSDVKTAQDSSSPKKVTDKPAEKTHSAASQPASPSNKVADKAPEKTDESASQPNKMADSADENSVEESAQPKKATAKSADELFANIKAKTEDVATPPAGDAGSNLPAAMLATLTTQNVAAAQSAPAAQSELAATSAEESVLGKKASGGAKDTASLDQAGLKQDVSAAGRKALPQATASVETKKDAAFSNMMENIKATAGPKLFETDEKAAALAAAPQPGAASLASMAATTQLAPATVMPTQVTIDTPVSHDKWGDEFNQKITWLSNQKEQTAELHLNPPQLGPMDVVLKVSGDQATALFTSPHAAVREAVEQALPRLREMLADSGIMLGNATVSDQAPRDRQDSQENRSSGSRSGMGGISDSTTPANSNVRVSPITRHNGIVDTFA